MKHIIVHGKDGTQERFKLEGELFHKMIPNSSLLVAESLKILNSEMDIREDYCLHFICHGNESSLKFGQPFRIDQIYKMLAKNHTPKIIFIYACHAGDDNGTAKKLNKRFSDDGIEIPVIGVGRCDSISKLDEDGTDLPAGAPISLLYSLVNSEQSEKIAALLKKVGVPSVCVGDSKGKIILRKVVVFGSLPENYTIKSLFGKLNINTSITNHIKTTYAYLLEDFED